MEMISFFKYLTRTKKENGNLAGLSILQHRKIYKEWAAQLKSGKFPLDMELPWITIIAKNYIESYLKNCTKSEVKVFEYGSGGSSLFFLKYANEVHSVEHDEHWFELVNRKIAEMKIQGWTGYLKLAEVGNHITENLDAGNPNHYYTKAPDFANASFKNYVTVIDKFPVDYFDIVLVDGRSRPACLLHSTDKIRKGGLLILDNSERGYYAPQNIIDPTEYELVLAYNSALIGNQQFTQTNIYLRK